MALNKRTTQGAKQNKVTVNNAWQAYVHHHKSSASDSLRRMLVDPVASAMTWLVLAIALALPMTLYVAMANIKQLSQHWDQTSQISVYLQKQVTAQDADALSRQIQGWPGIKAVTYIGADAALAEFSEQTGLGDVLTRLEDNPLPSVLSVVPDLNDNSSDELAVLQNRLHQLPGVERAQLDMQWVKRLYEFMSFGERLVWALALLLGLAVLLIIGNTIRLSIESRRDEIQVVKLIGATDAFVRRPFLYTGIWFGLGGGLLAWFVLSIGLWWLAGPVERLVALYGSDFQLHTLGLGDSLMLIGDGVMLGWLGAWVAVNQHISRIEP